MQTHKRTFPAGLRTASLLFAVLLLLGCGRRVSRVEHGTREGILHLGNGAEPSQLDPQVITGEPEHKLCMSMFEGLVSEDPRTLQPLPGVAERWDISPDQKTYTFHLRTNARWSNGDPVTALDFVKSYKRILTPALGSEYSYMLFPIRNAEEFNTGKITRFDEVGIRAIDLHTLEITLHSPTPYILALMLHSSWYPVPMGAVEQFGDPFSRANRWTRPQNIVCNGPFRLKEWKFNSYIRVEKNPAYWDAANVRLKEIYFYPIESEQVEERAFRAGQLHISHTVPLTKIDTYKREHPELIHIHPILSTYFLRLNVTRAPLNDKRVRRALSMAVNREDIVKYVTKGEQIPALFFTPPGTAEYTCRSPIHEGLAEARKLLAEAGYPNGANFPKIEILFNTMEAHRAIAEAVQQMWRKNLNIQVDLVNQEWKVFLTTTHKLDYFVARAGWNGDYVDPNTFLDMWVTDGGQNETGWSNPEYDRLIREAGSTNDTARRFESFQKAEGILMDELPIIPLYFYTRQTLIRPEVRGWYPTILDLHPYKYVHLEPGS